MKEYFESLYLYNKWANDKFMDVFLTQNVVPDKSLLWMSHIVAAEIIWFSRVSDKDFGAQNLWESLPAGEVRELQQKFDTLYIKEINQVTDFEKIIYYRAPLNTMF